MKTKLGCLFWIPGCFLVAEPTQHSSVDLCHSMKYSVDASFTYWYAKEDGLAAARSALIDPGAMIRPLENGEVFRQSFSYAPGFQVGLGIESSNRWQLHGEYTYYRSTNTTSRSAPVDWINSSLGVWEMSNWFLQSTVLRGNPLTGTHLFSRWNLGMDLGDLIVSRPFISRADDKQVRGGEFSPFGGLRTVWIRQKMDLQLTQDSISVGGSNFLPTQPVESNNNSNSWNIGPRFGAEGKYFFPYGLSVQGMLGASLLYTKFTTLEHEEFSSSRLLSSNPIRANMNGYNCVRPVLDTSLGIGWGTNRCKKWNCNLSIDYDFSYFWGQNMMVVMLDQFNNVGSSGDNDLYFQGVTANLAFSF
ncbi:MAG: hypothetical protein K2Y01_10505 [Rhabdochlamydiaceae bacterium]|nr:hypothetical protein [Rhabdochlamydiaceae bacterium]